MNGKRESLSWKCAYVKLQISIKRQIIQERVACLAEKIQAAKLRRPSYPEQVQEASESRRSKSRLHEVLI